jgi:hypothetical protein
MSAKQDTGEVTVDTALEVWDPMASDYYSKQFNSYLQGPGRSLSEMTYGRKKYVSLKINCFSNV